jgi:type V secretory pathway adhesin AidA
LNVRNVGGPGALTTGNGILVVDAINGATTAAGNFALSHTVEAGAYDYLLSRGQTSGTTDNWYLRSTLNCSLAPTNPACASAASIPLYRPAAGLYLETPEIARQSALLALGTFHERQGDQILVAQPGETNAQLSETNPPPGSWGRVFGEKRRQNWSGDLSPHFDGQIGGIQAGFDIGRFESAPHHEFDRGLFDADRQRELVRRRRADGLLLLRPSASGGRCRHQCFRPCHHRLARRRLSDRADADTCAGTPGPADRGKRDFQFRFRSLHDARLPQPTAFTGRIGLQLNDNIQIGGMWFEPRLLANIWHSFSGNDTAVFNHATTFATPFESTSFEIGGAVVARLTHNFGAYVQASYRANLGGQFTEAKRGMVGVRYSW